MKSFTNTLAILLLLACVAIVAAPALNGVGHYATAGQGGVVTVSATVRAAVPITHLPLTDLQASAQGYIIAVRWTNPLAPYSGALIEWDTDRVRQGTSLSRTWHEYEIYYPPASWTRISAPLGARYTIQGSAYYDGGTTRSVPATASVVLTSPVDITGSFSTTGYAASAALSRRYGYATYQRQFEAQLEVPGGEENYSLNSNPISWSPQLTGAPTMRVYKLASKPVRTKNRGKGWRYYWSRMPDRPALGPPTRHNRPWLHARTSFTDGYPALCAYPFTASASGVYKLVMTGEFSDGFAYQGSRKWGVTRYITLKPTNFKTRLTTPKVGSGRRHTQKIKFTGTLTPRRAATIKVTIQRRLRGRWTTYKTVNVKSKTTGTWAAGIQVKKAGTYRVRTTASGGIVDRFHEYTPAASAWTGFKVR